MMRDIQQTLVADNSSAQRHLSLTTLITIFNKMSSATLLISAPFAAAPSNGTRLTPNCIKKKLLSRSSWTDKTVSNGSKTHCMKTWNPIDNKKFETLSYLPPLSEESIAKQIDYMTEKKWIPCLEFDEVGYVYRENSRMPNYYDGRYWTLWKLPMFGCNSSSQVLDEIQECKNAYPSAYIRCLAFDNIKQGQCMSFLIQKPERAP